MCTHYYIYTITYFTLDPTWFLSLKFIEWKQRLSTDLSMHKIICDKLYKCVSVTAINGQGYTFNASLSQFPSLDKIH